MKRKQRYGDITIHSKAYVGGVLRSRYPHQRETFGAYALRGTLEAFKRGLSMLAAPFLVLADLCGRAIEALAGVGRRNKGSARVSLSPLYVPNAPLTDEIGAKPTEKAGLIKPSVIVAACALVPIAAFLVAFTLLPRGKEAQEVYFDDHGSMTVFRTDSATVGEFLDRNIAIDSADVVVTQRSAPIQEGMMISVRRAFPVVVTSRQATSVIELADGTVKDALDKLSIAVGDGDIVRPAPDDKLKPGMKIEHISVAVALETETIRLPFKKEVKKDSSLVKGKTKLKTEGRSGRKEITSRIVLHDGVEVSREVVSEEITREPVNQVMLEGTASDTIKAKKTISLRNDTRSSKGPPKRSQIKSTLVVEATAYTHTGNKTATGTQPKVGTIAVDPKVIPYGTKLYVEGYGYGRAEDTGAFRGREKKQIDLFMDTVKECINWGRKDVTIYILK